MKLFLPELTKRLKTHEPVRIAALGSSNTQRFQAGTHWFDCLELGTKYTYGLNNLFFNAGISGETSTDLLKRLDRDVIGLSPNLVIVTVGGNDSYHTDTIPLSKFHSNLKEIHSRLTACGAQVVFQTYYACDLEKMPENHPMPAYMEEIRRVSAETGTNLMDHWRRWNLLRENDISLYRRLMRDHMHVNILGNMLLGCDWLNALELHVNEDIEKILTPARFAQKVIDLLDGNLSGPYVSSNP